MRRYFVPLLVASIVGIVVVPVIGPTLARLSRPVAKTGVRTGLAIFRSGRVKLAELSETLEDMLAEARDDLAPDVTER